ncbi:MAG: alpha/beta fold hydrolase [Patescibacteria group bacterium]|jgi:hypothetical protein
MQQIEIRTKSGEVLSGNLFVAVESQKQKTPGLLLIHGWQSGQDRMFETAQMFSVELGVTCLTLDLRGHGKSEGSLSVLSRKDFLDDVTAGYDFLAERPEVDPAQIGVLGSSFGGYLSAILSSKRQVAWLVLRVPTDFQDDTFEIVKTKAHDPSVAGTWRQQPKNWEATHALRALHIFTGRVLIVASGKDELVPIETVLNYKNAVSGAKKLQYVVMKDAPHSLTRHPEFAKQFNEIVYEWYQHL